MLLVIGQVMHDALPLQVPCQRLPASPLLLLVRIRVGLSATVIVILAGRVRGFRFRIPRLPGGLEQRQLFLGKLLALTASLGIQ